MEKKEILAKVNEIGKDVFEDENLNLTETTVAKDVKNWDSLTHLSLINEIENNFKIKLQMREIQGAKNVGELVDFIYDHLKGEN
ncbi:MAG: acyl carrier protein [Clostridia bacterium]|nr:acyl carrier protein [Clostridia bacterium]